MLDRWVTARLPGLGAKLLGQPHYAYPLTGEPPDTQAGSLEGRKFTKADHECQQSEVPMGFLLRSC